MTEEERAGGDEPEELTPERIDRNQQVYEAVVEQYYGDPEFKARMDADPTAVLKAEGLEIPDGAKVNLLFNTENLLHIVLPAPAGGKEG